MASKRYTQLSEKIDSTKKYTVAESAAAMKDLASAKFDETIEIAMNLNVLKGFIAVRTPPMPNRLLNMAESYG